MTIQASAAVGGKEDPSIGYEYRRLREGVQTGWVNVSSCQPLKPNASSCLSGFNVKVKKFVGKKRCIKYVDNCDLNDAIFPAHASFLWKDLKQMLFLLKSDQMAVFNCNYLVHYLLSEFTSAIRTARVEASVSTELYKTASNYDYKSSKQKTGM